MALTLPPLETLTQQQEWDGEMFASPGKKEKSSSGGKKSSGDDGKNSNSNNKSNSSIDDKNKHLFFDEAVVTVCGGAGGDGESWTKEVKAKIVKNFKFSRGGNTKKFIELPPAEAADGGAGGNVYIRVDRACDSLLQFHDRKQWRAKKGYHGSAAPGAGAGRQDRTRIAPKQEDLYIDVPPGTVVRRKRSGELLGDMTKHGQVLLVAEGGAGGLAARRSQSMQRRGRNTKQQKLSDDIEVSDIELDDAVVVATNGEPGEELAVELLMRVVADIGLVGLPNAGKSSILKAVTRASPEVAAYPFTTLMPNLGVVKPADVKPVDPDDPMDFSAYDTSKPENGPVLADLPGLIQGAHKGRGLGRAFLRHLRRTRAMLVVVDASGQDPVGDYKTVREELRLYNPAYVTRPHILALNKMDLEWAALRTEELVGEIKKLDSETVGDAPIAVLPVSAMEGIGMDALLTELGSLMEEEDDARVEGIKKPKRQTTGEGTNMKIRF
tara:strand:+ start:3500 stop:4984 length:1485 start_codon:yes stop_codon:yes gene_type:complete